MTVFDVGEWNGRPYIVMEYVDGGSLDDRLREGPAAGECVRGSSQAAGARRGACTGDRPPRRQAGEPPARPRRPGAGGRLRIAERGRARPADRAGHRARHRRLPLARAGAGRRARPRATATRSASSRGSCSPAARRSRATRPTAEARRTSARPCPAISEARPRPCRPRSTPSSAARSRRTRASAYPSKPLGRRRSRARSTKRRRRRTLRGDAPPRRVTAAGARGGPAPDVAVPARGRGLVGSPPSACSVSPRDRDEGDGGGGEPPRTLVTTVVRTGHDRSSAR